MKKKLTLIAVFLLEFQFQLFSQIETKIRANHVNGDQSGFAYIYERDNFEWIKHSLLIPEDGNTTDQFGENVWLSGNFAICGAQFDDGANSSAKKIVLKP